MTLSDLVASIDAERRHGNLSSAIRLFVLDYYRALSASAPTEPKNQRLIEAREPQATLQAE
jgi:predicted DNA-binding ribbon-helix-helix protein